MSNSYDQGSVVVCKTAQPFTSGGVPVDPTPVTFVCKKPDGTYLRYLYGVDIQLVRDSTGTYRVNVTGDVASVSIPYQYRFYSGGTYAASAREEFFILPDELV